MVDLLVKQAALAIDPVFRSRVEEAMFVACIAVANEAVGAQSPTVYQKRHTFAVAALTNPNAFLDRFAWAVAANGTVAAGIQPPVAIASSTAANPSVITTAASHGFVNGDTVSIVGHAVNTAANGGWIVTNLTATTFSIPVLGIGAGTATGTATKQPTDSDMQFTVNSLISGLAGVAASD
jgi:hypothetical protein